jgi:hypothetical protein
VQSTDLHKRKQMSTVSKSSSLAIAVSVKTLETEQSASQKESALRLVCRALLRLYLRDHGN